VGFQAVGHLRGTYELRFSPLLRHQAGQNFARTLTVGSSVAQGFAAIYASGTSSVVYAEPGDARRHDNITVLDLRIERGFTLPHNMRIRGSLDLFNITNSNAAETRTTTTGTSFLRPTAVLAPRTARVGARFSW
jgi:TonB dependent receptor